MPIYYKNVKTAGLGGGLLPIDKIGTPSANLDLSDIDTCVFGTPAEPWEIDTATLLSFVNITLPVGYRKLFVLYIKVTAEVAVTWNDVPLENWLYREAPLLPLNETQEIRIEAVHTTNGIVYFGAAGGYL